MRSSIRALVIAWGLAFAVPASAAEPVSRVPNDGAVEKARASFQQGVDLFHEGNFEAALAEFRKAYATAPSYRILYNIAQAYFEMHDYVNALKSYEQYLVDGGAEIAPSRRTQVEETNQKLRTRIAYIDIRVSADGADVQVDDVLVGKSPLAAPVAVNPGPRRLSASKAGAAAATQTIAAAGGDRVTVTLDLADANTPRTRFRSLDLADGVSRSSGGDAGSPSRAPLVVSLATMGVSAVATGVLGWLTLRAKRDFDNHLDTFNVSPTQLDSDRSRLRAFALATDVAAVVTLAAGGFSLYFALSGGSESTTQTSGPRAFVALTPTLGGAAVHGGW